MGVGETSYSDEFPFVHLFECTVSRVSNELGESEYSSIDRTSRLVHDELWVHHNSSVIRPFSPNQPQNNEQRGDRDNTTGIGSNARIFDCLGEGI